jgi:hypothetical protein
VLADLVRTDRHNHRPIAGASAEVGAIKLLAREHQTLIWSRTRHTNRLRNALREHYPAALATFDELAGRDALAVLAKAPSARLTLAQIRGALRRGGRQRNLDAKAAQIQAGLRTGQLQAAAPVTDAFAAIARSEIAIIAELNRQIETLETAQADRFEQHPGRRHLPLPARTR